MKRPLFILAGNGPYLNRGCEAIVRGTVKIIRRHFTDPRFLVCSYFPSKNALAAQREQEFDKDIEHVRMIPVYWAGKSIGSKGKQYVLDHCARLRRERTYRELLPRLCEAKAVLSVGGDNYSLDYETLRLYTDLDDLALNKKKKLIIWGASIGPFDRRPEDEIFMAAHLKKQAAIFSRESYTRGYLEKIGVIQNVFDVADPAFLMESRELAGASKFDRLGETIGLNLSPLMGRYACRGEEGRWLPLAREIVCRIKNEFNLPVLLIPHVVDENPDNNDYLFLKAVAEDPRLKGVEVLDPGYSSRELKWIISKLRVFAGARTHATIAALSSCVPTVSFSYSPKALGINQDIFSSLDYCLKPGALNPERVCAVLSNVLRRQSEIRAQLAAKMPEVFDLAHKAGYFLKRICEGG